MGVDWHYSYSNFNNSFGLSDWIKTSSSDTNDARGFKSELKMDVAADWTVLADGVRVYGQTAEYWIQPDILIHIDPFQ